MIDILDPDNVVTHPHSFLSLQIVNGIKEYTEALRLRAVLALQAPTEKDTYCSQTGSPTGLWHLRAVTGSILIGQGTVHPPSHLYSAGLALSHCAPTLANQHDRTSLFCTRTPQHERCS